MKIGIVLPAYNVEDYVVLSLSRIKKGIEAHPDHDFKLYVVNDGSVDSTGPMVLTYQKMAEIDIDILNNPVNLGTAPSMKRGFEAAIKDGCDVIIKTDMDNDFDQSGVIGCLSLLRDHDLSMVYCERVTDSIVATYETDLTQKFDSICRERLDVSIAPFDIGSQIYKARALSTVMKTDEVVGYDNRWGLDVILVLYFEMLGHAVKIGLPGTYDSGRRTREKAEKQFENFLDIVSILENRATRDG